jgi:hypothetical protein
MACCVESSPLESVNFSKKTALIPYDVARQALADYQTRSITGMAQSKPVKLAID